MGFLKRVGYAAVLGAVSGGIAAPALAVGFVNADDEWQHGVTGGKVFSNYWHRTPCHGASVQGKEFVRITNVPGGIWASAKTEKRMFNNEAFYHTC